MPSDPFWASVRWEYDANDDPTYLGKHKAPGAAANDIGWYVWKYAVDASGNVSISGPKIGAWSNRTVMF